MAIDDVRVNIHNSQIIVFDCYYFDDTVEYQRSDSRGSRVGLGLMLAGPIGAAVGLASSFGKGHKHVKSHNLIIAYWNTVTKQKEITMQNFFLGNFYTCMILLFKRLQHFYSADCCF